LLVFLEFSSIYEKFKHQSNKLNDLYLNEQAGVKTQQRFIISLYRAKISLILFILWMFSKIFCNFIKIKGFN